MCTKGKALSSWLNQPGSSGEKRNQGKVLYVYEDKVSLCEEKAL